MDQYPAVGPRVPKDEFMRALGLDHQNPTHENFYRQMRVRLSPLRILWKLADLSFRRWLLLCTTE